MRAGSCGRLGHLRLPSLRAGPQCTCALLSHTPLSSKALQACCGEAPRNQGHHKTSAHARMGGRRQRGGRRKRAGGFRKRLIYLPSAHPAVQRASFHFHLVPCKGDWQAVSELLGTTRVYLERERMVHWYQLFDLLLLEWYQTFSVQHSRLTGGRSVGNRSLKFQNMTGAAERPLRLVSLRIVWGGLMPALVFSQLVSLASCLCAQDRAPSLPALCARSLGPPPPPIASPGTAGAGERTDGTSTWACACGAD